MRKAIRKRERSKKPGAAPAPPQAAPPHSATHEALAEASADDAALMLTADDLLDTYTFEELACAGPLPHTSQPVQPTQWSPRILAPSVTIAPSTTKTPVLGMFSIRHLPKERMPVPNPKRKGGFVMQLGAPLDPDRSTRIPAFFPVTRMFNRAPKAPPKRAPVLATPVK